MKFHKIFELGEDATVYSSAKQMIKFYKFFEFISF